MRDGQRPSHVRWDGKYHLVFVPQSRRRVLSGQLRRRIGRSLRDLCQQPGGELVEGHAMPAHGPLCLSRPPPGRGAQTVGGRQGKAARRMHRECWGRERHCTGRHGWARGYGVSTGGVDEPVIRESIRQQEQEEKCPEELPRTGLSTLA